MAARSPMYPIMNRLEKKAADQQAMNVFFQGLQQPATLPPAAPGMAPPLPPPATGLPSMMGPMSGMSGMSGSPTPQPAPPALAPMPYARGGMTPSAGGAAAMPDMSMVSSAGAITGEMPPPDLTPEQLFGGFISDMAAQGDQRVQGLDLSPLQELAAPSASPADDSALQAEMAAAPKPPPGFSRWLDQGADSTPIGEFMQQARARHGTAVDGALYAEAKQLAASGEPMPDGWVGIPGLKASRQPVARGG